MSFEMKMNGVDIVGDIRVSIQPQHLGLAVHVGQTIPGTVRPTPYEFDLPAETLPIHFAGQSAVSGPVLLRAREAIGDFVVNLAPLPRGKTRELPDVQG